MKGIKYLLMDVDGTLTDGKIYMGADGEAMKAFNIKDGCGIALILPEAGITPVIITSRRSMALERRCAELGITHLYQGVKDKVARMDEIVSASGDALSSVAYIGDDLNDIPCMRAVKAAGGITACPADAASAVLGEVDFVASHKGGDGAVREFIEYLTR